MHHEFISDFLYFHERPVFPRYYHVLSSSVKQDLYRVGLYFNKMRLKV